MIEGGATANAASRATGVAVSTLRDRIHGRKAWNSQHGGANKVLTTAEEQFCVAWCLEMTERGLPPTMVMLADEVKYVLSGDTRETPFTDGRPGRHWCEAFLRRNPALSEKLAQAVTHGRMALTVEACREWHNDALQFFIKHDLLEALYDPARVFNMDETGFQLEAVAGRRRRVLVGAGSKQPYALKAGTRTMITVAACMSANGEKTRTLQTIERH